MKTQLHSTKQPNLLIYFAGWNTPIGLIQHLTIPADYDLLICYDYQDLGFDRDLSHYQQIRVVSWSMGVWVAERVLQSVNLISATAINGTGLPCHDQFGIPEAIFIGTLENLTEQNLLKFNRRMCNNRETLAVYNQFTNQPDITKARSELTALFTLCQQDQRTDLISWTKAIISQQDRIFPVENQHAYWQSRVPITEIDGAHYVFSQFNHWNELW